MSPASRWVSVVVLGAAVTVPALLRAQAPSQVGQWSTPFDFPLVAVHKVLMHTGKVLMWDAFERGPNAWVWNPTTGVATAEPHQLSNPFCAAQVTLLNGKVLVVGGHQGTAFHGTTDTSLFDPQTESWSLTASMTYPRWYPTATTLQDGRVLVVSGAMTCQTCIADTPEVYDPATNTWTQLVGARLTMPLYPFMFQLPDGRVAWAGSNEVATVTRALDVASQTWTTIDPTLVPGGSAAMFRPGRILKAGSPARPGLQASAPAITSAFVIDMNQPSPAWRAVGAMALRRAYHTLTLLPDGTVLVTGGVQSTNERSTQAALAAEIWDPLTERWTTMAAGQMIRSYHSTALLLTDGRVLVAGSGGSTGVTDQFNGEIFSPPYLFKGPRPTITSAPDVIDYGARFPVQTPDSTAIASVALIRLGAVTHGLDHDQRYIPLTFTRTTGALDVAAPANGATAPPGHYMLFILNSDGVPSIASFVRLQTAPDTTRPIVALTTPVAGATVSGTVTVSATASDNIGVAGVQFLLDGNALGAEDTTAPYSISWTTTGTSNGTHLLSARARDAAGNRTTSASVSVTVSNGATAGGPIAAYALDEGSGTLTTDASGSGHHGTLVNAPAWVAGHTGRALSFDGVNDYVQITTLPYLPQWTISAWVRSPAIPAGTGDSGPIHRATNFQINWNHPSPAFRGAAAVNVGGTWHAASFGPLAANTWYYLVATYDGETLRAYSNAVLITSNAAPSGPSTAATNPLRLGAHAVNSSFFRGIIDDVRLFNRALSLGEIQQNMQTPVGP